MNSGRRNSYRSLVAVVLAGSLAGSCSSSNDQAPEPTSPPIATSIAATPSTALGSSASVTGSVDEPSPTAAPIPENSETTNPATTNTGTPTSSPAITATTVASKGASAATAPAITAANGSVIPGVTLPPLSATPTVQSPVTSLVVPAQPIVSVPSTGVALTLLTYDSFALSKGLLEGFTAATGIGVIVRKSGDSGDMVRDSVFARETPLGDVMWGVGTTNFYDAFSGSILYPYMARSRSDMPAAFTRLVPNNEATPVAYRDVCVNYDKKELASQNLSVPTSFEDLVKPEFNGKFVVENPATSTTGLAFLLATISHFGADGWKPYWTALKANNVKVVNSWAEAYQSNFTAGNPAALAPGTFPLVVSYGSSPANAVALSANPAATEAPTGVVAATCFRDVEFVALIIGTRRQAEAAQLIEFLSSVPVQEDLPLSMFLHPANSKARLPKSFTNFVVSPATPITLDPKLIAASKPRWIAEWKTVGL
jgi:thiamine transport system substrate-binding protein